MPNGVLLVFLLAALAGPAGGPVYPATALQAAEFDPTAESPANPDTPDTDYPEMRASIVDRDGDQFIAKTETGHEFRLPVQGAPPDTNVGDTLRLVPDPDTRTMNVFKADPTDGGQAKEPEFQL